MNGSSYIAKWAHLEMLYQMDNSCSETKLLPKLTDFHIIRERIPKMKVKYAAQVFSQRVSATMQ